MLRLKDKTITKMFGFFKRIKAEPPKVQQVVLSRQDIKRLFIESYPRQIPTFLVINDWEGFENTMCETTPEMIEHHWIAFDRMVGRFLASRNMSKFTNYHHQ